jgi:hypothetical protein
MPNDSSNKPTTPGQDETALRSAGQRNINRVWEYTQAVIAVAVTVTTLCVCGYMAAARSETSAFMLLSNVFFLVVGTYFQRTNHTKSSNAGSEEEHR